MPEHNRFTSYIYLYEKGIKIKNIGFARMHTTEQICRVEIKLRGVHSVNQRSGKAYFFSRKKEKLLGTYLGDVKLGGGTGAFSAETEAKNIMNTGLNFSGMGGILIWINEETVFATEWDDLGIQPKNFEIYEAEKEVEKEEIAAQNSKEMHVPQPEPSAEPAPEQQAEIRPEQQTDSQPQPEQQIEMQPQPEIRPEIQPPKKPEPKPEKEEAIPLTWKQMVEKFPVFPAFQDDEIVECIRMQPKDLSHLPKKEWILGNNSFMLHGYYNYKYLLMGRKGASAKETIILGVPGVYHEQEKMMASMFGFPNFKAAKKVETKQGVFGYWYRIVSVETD